jgi:hypothetical protein
MSKSALAALFVLATLATAAASECRDDRKRVDACFSVHGRIAIGANLRLRLWPVGTHRLLAIAYPPDGAEKDPYMPENLHRMLDLQSAIFGDYEICPLSPDRPGRMRFACVQTATRLIRKPY